MNTAMKKFRIYTFIIVSVLTFRTLSMKADDGHRLWLRSESASPVNVECSNQSTTLDIAINELQENWRGKAGETVVLKLGNDSRLNEDGFLLTENKIEANTEIGILYGVFDLLRRQQTGQTIKYDVVNPSYRLRLLNHWDNLDGTVERGYAGNSIFWHGENGLPVSQEDLNLWREYARANASIGINGTVLNNVNASPKILSAPYLKRSKAVADVIRSYGMKTFLAVNFASPEIVGGLATSDPLDPDVIKWWNTKIKELYKLIPDFGGFLIKANSEGQPGPQDFGRTHADGANMLADILEPLGGIVMWRAFVYNPSDEDRAKQAYREFVPLDGQFRDNVIVQVKNGPVDFQPREPFSPLFGAMKKTVVMPELQVTQEYLGHSVHLVFLAPLWKEFLASETWQEGKGSTVARCTDGTIFKQKYSAIAGVANIGLDINWCGHDFAQANWYAFGRLAWNNSLSCDQIAEEWLKLTFPPEKNIPRIDWNLNFLIPIKQMMLESREAAVNYMMPLGLHHIFAPEHHYGPAPWWGPEGVRRDWTPPYYHQANKSGIGFDRTKTGSNALGQYHSTLAAKLDDRNTCPDSFLLWFHHLPWDFKMKSNRSLWDELCYHYDSGVQQVRQFQNIWDKTRRFVDSERFGAVQKKLCEQSLNAVQWKDACLLYFQQFSQMPIPIELERPLYDLEDLMKTDFNPIIKECDN
jgi:alpha-glucuronidase